MREVPGSNPGATTIFTSYEVHTLPKTRAALRTSERSASFKFLARTCEAAPRVGATLGVRAKIEKELPPAMPLTDVAVRSAKPREKMFKLSDSGGLYLQVTTTGGK